MYAKYLNTGVFFLHFTRHIRNSWKSAEKVVCPKKVCRLSLLFGLSFSLVFVAVVIAAFFAFGQRQFNLTFYCLRLCVYVHMYCCCAVIAYAYWFLQKNVYIYIFRIGVFDFLLCQLFICFLIARFFAVRDIYICFWGH